MFQSLDQFYTDRRTSRLASSSTPSSPHEAEFCGYLLLAHIWDVDILRKTEALPAYLYYTPEVQLALSLAYLAQRSNDPHAGRSKPTSELSQNLFTRFFKTVQRGTTPYLVACLVESHFGDIRKAGLLGLKKSFVKQYSTVAVEDLVGMLGCDDVRDVAEVCEEFGLRVSREDGVPVSVEVSRESVIIGKSPLVRPIIRPAMGPHLLALTCPFQIPDPSTTSVILDGWWTRSGPPGPTPRSSTGSPSAAVPAPPSSQRSPSLVLRHGSHPSPHSPLPPRRF